MTQTIFMIHGMWGGHPQYWENYQAFFRERGYECVAPSLRFHSVSPDAAPDPRLGSTSLLDYASDLEQEIRAMHSPPIVMGHSMGGLLAQILGSRGLAKALILLTPASPAGIFAIRPTVLRTFFRVMTKWAFWNKPMRLTFDEAVYSTLHLLSDDDRRNIYSRMVHESGRAAFEIGFWFLDTNGASRVDESKVTCPVLIIGGAQDRITPVSVVRQVAKKYGSRATYVELADHAHWVLHEPGWNEIASGVADWLGKAGL